MDAAIPVHGAAHDVAIAVVAICVWFWRLKELSARYAAIAKSHADAVENASIEIAAKREIADLIRISAMEEEADLDALRKQLAELGRTDVFFYGHSSRVASVRAISR